MRRIARIDRSIDLLRVRTIASAPVPYLCRACKQSHPSFSTSSLQAAKSSETSSFTEKIRRRIWGTDTPLGQENPYGEASVFDQTKKNAAKRESEKRTVAATPDLGDYEPAATWDGLEKVGGFGNWWKHNWDPEHQFKGFLPQHIMSDPAEITASLHRAIVEVLALRQAGKPLDGISAGELGDDLTHQVQLKYSNAGPVLDFGSQEAFEELVQSLAPAANGNSQIQTESEDNVTADRSREDPLHPSVADETAVKENPTESEEDVAADRSEVDPLNKASATSYEELVASWDPSWLEMPLEDPDVKFAVLKRTLQLTGIRLSDSLITPTRTVQSLLSHLIVPPKPSKLVEALAQKEDLMTLPNVSVYANRVTPIDKEKTIGRWKLIEKELEERGLPVTGHQV